VAASFAYSPWWVVEMLGQLMLAKNWPVSVSTILKESSNNCLVALRASLAGFFATVRR
jgi:hypothetical protein